MYFLLLIGPGWLDDGLRDQLFAANRQVQSLECNFTVTHTFHKPPPSETSRRECHFIYKYPSLFLVSYVLPDDGTQVTHSTAAGGREFHTLSTAKSGRVSLTMRPRASHGCDFIPRVVVFTFLKHLPLAQMERDAAALQGCEAVLHGNEAVLSWKLRRETFRCTMLPQNGFAVSGLTMESPPNQISTEMKLEKFGEVWLPRSAICQQLDKATDHAVFHSVFELVGTPTVNGLVPDSRFTLTPPNGTRIDDYRANPDLPTVSYVGGASQAEHGLTVLAKAAQAIEGPTTPQNATPAPGALRADSETGGWTWLTGFLAAAGAGMLVFVIWVRSRSTG